MIWLCPDFSSLPACCSEKAKDIFHNIIINRINLHVGRGALDMHNDIWNVKMHDCRKHIRIQCPAGDIIDHVSPFPGCNPGNFSTVSINRNNYFRVIFPDLLSKQVINLLFSSSTLTSFAPGLVETAPISMI